MGGHSRFHKKRARENRKKCINLNVVSTNTSSNATMEMPQLTSNISDVKSTHNNDVNKYCETDNEVKTAIENKLLDKVQTNYRVESPKTVTLNQRRNSGTVVKSKSLDDDDLVKITEISETSECEDKTVSECNAVITEANSDIEWEETTELKSESSEKQYGEMSKTTSFHLEQESGSIQINLISPEDEQNLGTSLHEINLMASPEDECEQLQKKEGYKERKARKRAAIAEHFMPVLQQPRYLEAIKEESSDNSDRDSIYNGAEQKRIMTLNELPTSCSERVVVYGGNLNETANVEGMWSTSIAETSNFDTEFVYIDDSDEISEPDEYDTNTENDVLKCESQILPPASQLTPPPTPDSSTPQNEMAITTSLHTSNYINGIEKFEMEKSYIKSDTEFDREFEYFCEGLNMQTNPQATNSRDASLYNRTHPSAEEVRVLLNNCHRLNVFEPCTLKELCVKVLVTLPYGAEILEELAQVSRGIEELTSGWQSQLSLSLQKLLKRFPPSVTPPIMLKHYNERDTNDSFTVPATRKEMPLNPYEKWVGIPTQDPKVLVCLSPTQKSHLETTCIVPNEAGKLLELHQMYLNRRGYHEENSNKRDDHSKITKLSSELDAINENLSQPTKFSNRLLAIIRESSNSDGSSNVYFGTKPDKEGDLINNIKLNLNAVMDANSDKKPEHKYLESSNLERDKSASVPELSHATTARTSTESHQSKVLNESTRMQSSVGNTTRSTDTSNRRFSLPQEVYQRQLRYIREKEKEIQDEIEKLEEAKRKLLFEMTSEVPPKQFETSQYHISKKGDIAIYNDENLTLKNDTEQKSVTAPTEIFRQQMYNEYMQKVADREERKLQKVIKITSSRTVQNDDIIECNNNVCEVTHVSGIENEFMDKVKERMQKYGLERNDSEESRNVNLSDREDSTEPVLVIDGDSVKHSKELPKHLQEFVDITRRAAENSENDTKEGVWSPGQKNTEEIPKEEVTDCQQEENEPIPSVWTPRSAGASPTAERKEFKPVNFGSPTLDRKHQPTREGSKTSEEISLAQAPWKAPTSSSELGTSLSSILERRLPTSHSAPSTGFSEFSTSRLPRAQNPTITLLQKAREGQLPRGASYIQTDHYKSKDDKPPILAPGQVLYQIKSEYTVSDSDSERPKKMADLSPKRYEMGIGPMTRDGMPLVLRSEVKDGNQSRWYKKMYDTIHKQKPEPRYPYASGYFSEPEQHSAFSAYYYDSDGTTSDNKYATLDRRRVPPSRDKEYEFMSSTLPRNRDIVNLEVIPPEQDVYRNAPGRIENYTPGRSSISEKEAKEHLEQQKGALLTRGHMSQALKESGYESDSTLIFRRREDALQQLSPSEQREAYKVIQKGGDVPLQGLRKPAPERPKELPPPTPPPKGHHGLDFFGTESPRRYVENDVTIHYKTPVRQEIKDPISEEELSRRQAEHMKRVYEEERRRKYLQELQDMNSRRHTDNFIPSQKSPIPLNRYDDFLAEDNPKIKPRPRSPEHRLVARALYNFVGQSARELTFRKGDIIYIRRQVDKNWYEGEHNAMIGLFPANYVEIIPYDGAKSTPRRNHEGQARAKFNFIAQTHLELSLAKGELVVITRRVDDNWFEGRIGGRKGIFPVSYVDVLIDPSTPPPPIPSSSKPVASPAAHSLLLNGSAGGKESMGSHKYTPSMPYQQQFSSSYRAKPIQIAGTSYGSSSKSTSKNPINEVLHIDTHSEPVPYRALYKYRPQNDDELELLEGDVVYVLEKCDDGWYVGSSQRTGAFGTFPGNYVERI
ncbi:hypothetical protein RI129_001121 [Pyrocoelia pectoralis]|uniref:Sorbin and SH3 domain-containing protein 1 n=1 Tax=Pyrocoelia pectoralis TaxID=417401 RepID=A0AAN7ZPG1_9COLE